MYDQIDIIYAFATDSSNYSKQSYQKLVERSLDEKDFSKNSERINNEDSMDITRNEMRK